MVSAQETAATLNVAAIGIVVPQLVQNWATFLLTIISIIWVTFQIVVKIIEFKEERNKKNKK